MQTPYEFGLSTNALKSFDGNKKHAEKLEDLFSLRDAPIMINIAKHYIRNFIPTPIENENEYWMCSCFADDYTPIRININWHEVFNFSEADDSTEDDEKWMIVTFTNKEYLTQETIRQLLRKIPKLKFDKDFTYKRGLDTQLAAIFPIESYFAFVADERVFESIRRYNYELSCKGKLAQRGHNYELARVLLRD